MTRYIFEPVASCSRTICEGDTVIVYMSRDVILAITVTPGQVINSQYGRYNHSDMIGVPFGSKILSSNGSGYTHLLRPTPELWTLALPHRTQILYAPDIAFISSHLDVKPGSKVIESGTGSGSFTHSLARTVGAKGKVFSFEFHEQRYEQAQAEFDLHGMSDIVTLQHRNVCKDGFGLEGEVDAVFLDLPAPWEAVEAARDAMNPNHLTRICCFSPCMEQVIKTVNALNAHGFSDVTMYETLTRNHEGTAATVTPISEVIDKLRTIEQRKEKRRQIQIETAKRKKEEAALEAQKVAEATEATDIPLEGDIESHKRKTPPPTEPEDANEAASPKKARIEALIDEEVAASPSVLSESANATPEASAAPSPSIAPRKEDAPKKPETMLVTRALTHVRGHTSYLTFANLLPAKYRIQQSAAEEAFEETPTTNGQKTEEITSVANVEKEQKV